MVDIGLVQFVLTMDGDLFYALEFLFISYNVLGMYILLCYLFGLDECIRQLGSNGVWERQFLPLVLGLG